MNPNQEPFSVQNIKTKDPLKQFESWFNEANQNTSINEPNAVCLATCSKDGIPSCRMMSIARFDERGFLFFTNLKSQKAKELEANPKASLCFYWEPLHRQVAISGVVEQLSRDEAKTYFDQMPFESQIKYHVSEQGKPISDKQELIDDQLAVKIRKQFEKDQQLPLPENWGGFIVVPELYEFWQKGPNNFDDIIRFQIRSNGLRNQTSERQEIWTVEQIAP